MFFSKKLNQFNNINHCFFSKNGGFSNGIYNSLNCGHGSDDKKENVLIFPELNYTIAISKQFKNIQKVLWWMSFDNFLIFRFSDKNHKIVKSFIKLPFPII